MNVSVCGKGRDYSRGDPVKRTRGYNFFYKTPHHIVFPEINQIRPSLMTFS